MSSLHTVFGKKHVKNAGFHNFSRSLLPLVLFGPNWPDYGKKETLKEFTQAYISSKKNL